MLKPPFLNVALLSTCLALLTSAAVASTTGSSGDGESATSPKKAHFAGVIKLSVDATDLDHRIMTVNEKIPVTDGTDLTLLFPKWSIDHAPNGPVDRLVNLRVTAGDAQLNWRRDLHDVNAFHIAVVPGVRMLDVSYQILQSLETDEGPVLMSATMLDLQWPAVLLYPAGYDVGGIHYDATVRLPPGWRFASALTGAERNDLVTFAQAPMNVLADSPMMAAKYLKTISVVEGSNPVQIDLAADKPEDLKLPDGFVEGYCRLVAEAGALFGRVHYSHYDLMIWESGSFGPVYYEHRQSEEVGLSATTLQAWNTRPEVRSVFVHDYVHTWNGILRRPVGTLTDNFNDPQQGDMLWVTEGLTEYWRKLLAARAGLITRQDYLDELSDLAAQVSTSAGARWRTLADVDADAIIMDSKSEPWPDWQRVGSNAYDQGHLIWLEADALIRQRTGGQRSLDDFATAFFGASGRTSPTYTIKDIIAALNQVTAYDWANFFRTHVDQIDATPGLTALKSAGYKLVFSGDPSPSQAAVEARRGAPILRYALGLTVDGKGKVLSVAWDSPAWRAGLAPGGDITAVNGAPFSGEVIKAATRTAVGAPLLIKVKTGEGVRVYSIVWQDGLRYPHLERIAGSTTVLDDALKPHASIDKER